MSNKPRFIKKRLSQIIAAGLLTGMGVSAYAGDFSLVDNQITIVGGGTLAVSSEGVAAAATYTAGMLPNVSFGLENNSNSTGTYYVRLRMRVDSQTDNDLVTMSLGVVKVDVNAGSITNVSVVTVGQTNYEQVSVSATKQSGSSTTNLSSNIPANAAMISFNAGTVTVQVDEVVSRLTGDNDLFDDILGGFMLNDHYDYRIGIESVGAAPTTLSVGHEVGGTFTAFPRLLNACSGFTVLGTLTVGNPAAGLIGATAVAESGCDVVEEEEEEEEEPVEGEPDPVVDEEDLEQIEEELTGIDNALDNLGEDETVAETVLTAIDTALTNGTNVANTLLNSLQPPVGGDDETPPVLNTANTLNSLGTIAKTVNTSATVSTRTGNADTTQTLVQQNVSLVTTTATVMTALADAPRETPLSTAQQTQVQEITSNLVSSIDSVITSTTSTATLQSLAQSTASALQAQAKLGVPATAAQVDAMVNVSVKIATALIQQAVTEGGGTAPTDDEIRELLTSNPALLESVVENTLPIPPTTTLTITERVSSVNTAVTQRGITLPAAASQRAAQATQSFVNPANVQVGGINVLSILSNFLSGGTTTLLTFLDENGRVGSVLSATDAGASISVDEATGAVVVRVPGETYSGMIVAVRAVPDTVPNGITFRRNGRAMIVTGGVAVELAPTSVDVIGFIAALENMGYAYTQRNDASFSLNIGGGQRFVGVFAYNNLLGKSLDNCGAITFGEPTGALNSPDYAFTLKCANGVEQKILPYASNANFYASMQAANLSVSTDRNTGVITVQGVGRLKPSFFITTPTTAELAFNTANKDANGLAFQAADVNGDGRMDYKVISATGVQVFFGTN